MAHFLLSVVMAAQAAGPYQLAIGVPGQVEAKPGLSIETRTGRTVTVDKIAEAADGKRFVYLGESHDSAAHHQMQADIIEALTKRGRDVIVGFEMFTRPKQDDLAGWTLGKHSEEEFLEKSEWKTQWGFDFALYRPIFTVTKKYSLPMVALNVPRDWVRQVGRNGLSALTAEQKAQLPEEIYLGNKEHRAIFTSLMGGHPMTGAQGENVYSAQVLWDEGMADTAIRYLNDRPGNRKTVFVVVAGSGHVMYGQGINYRVKRRTGEDGVTVVMIDGTAPMKVSRGLADFVFMAPPPKRS